jgi:hypothetical protein
MDEKLYTSLLELQSMDRQILEAETTLQQFDPRSRKPNNR